MELSVVIPAYNPPAEHLQATLESLRCQMLPLDRWELLVVDNRSNPPVAPETVAWHPHGKLVREEKPGLVAARQAGFTHSTGEIIVVVDQDNILAPDFLATVLRIGAEHPWLGTWGGVIAPSYERPELAPPRSLESLLTLRTATRSLWSNDLDHHDSTPWGAGLCLRRNVAVAHGAALESNPLKGSLDLCGDQRLSGGDTDISYTACHLGLGKGVFVELQMEHLIPAERCTAEFLCKTSEGRGYSQELHHLVLHGKLPPLAKGPLAALTRLWRRRNLAPLERKVQLAKEAGIQRAHAELRR